MSQKKPVKVKVQKQSPTDEGWEFVVWIGDEESRSEHTVALDRDYWHKLTKSIGTPADLIKKSFEFLLNREEQDLIFKSFDLREIKKYFPEFEKEITPDEPYLEAREVKKPNEKKTSQRDS